LSQANLKTYLKGFLKKAIPKFIHCQKDLENNVNFSTDTFTITLTLTEQVILSNLMGIEWFTKEVQDVTQFNGHLSDTDFKKFSEANNLKEKNNYLIVTREVVNQDMTNYEIKSIPWSEWAGGNYGI
jgi:hypothetical protein